MKPACSMSATGTKFIMSVAARAAQNGRVWVTCSDYLDSCAVCICIRVCSYSTYCLYACTVRACTLRGLSALRTLTRAEILQTTVTCPLPVRYTTAKNCLATNQLFHL